MIPPVPSWLAAVLTAIYAILAPPAHHHVVRHVTPHPAVVGKATVTPTPTQLPAATSTPTTQTTMVALPATPTPTATEAPTATVSVSIANRAFSVSRITVVHGTTVLWTNMDTQDHTVTATDGSWSSTVLGHADTYSRVFAVPGTYTYHCAFHPSMTGTVVVQ